MTRSAELGRKPPRATGRRVSGDEVEVEYRYGSIRILRDGEVRFSAKTTPGLPELDFSVSYVTALGHGVYIEDRANYVIDARWPGNSSFFVLFVDQRRVRSACFNFALSPDELRRAVGLLRRAGRGLERWIIPGLEMVQRSLSERGARFPEMPRIITDLIESVRDLPVAEPWKRQRRDSQLRKSLPTKRGHHPGTRPGADGSTSRGR